MENSNRMPFCTQCGHENPDGAKFCARCGQPLTGGGGADDSSSGFTAQDTTTTLPAVGATAGAEDSLITDRLSDDDQAAVRALPGGSALMVVRRGPNEGSRFLMQSDEIHIGRHPDSEIFLDDITVSRRHSTITRSAEGWTIADGGSLNGTYVRRTLIDGGVVLRHGDEVQVGKFRFTFFASSHDLS